MTLDLEHIFTFPFVRLVAVNYNFVERHPKWPSTYLLARSVLLIGGKSAIVFTSPCFFASNADLHILRIETT